MALDRITLSHFRNHPASRLDGSAELNLLVGENGAGKTNVLEALSLFAPGRGLRRAPLAEMAEAEGPGGFAASAQLDRGDGGEPVRLGTGVAPDRPGRRQVQVNGAEASAATLGEWLAVGWLTPAMDGLFADSGSARRNPRPGANSDKASSTLVLPAPFSPTSRFSLPLPSSRLASWLRKRVRVIRSSAMGRRVLGQAVR